MPYDTNIDFNEPDNLAANQSPLNPTSFRLVIDGRKYVNAVFNVQTFSLPDISASPVALNLPRRNIGLPADKVEYSPFDLTFLIDEDLVNYKEIHEWIVGQVTEDDQSVKKTRDMSLMILNSNLRPTREIKFYDAYPISLSSLSFDATAQSVDYLTASATFQYSYYRIL